MNGTWDTYGQLVTVLMFMAMVAYVAPGMMSLTSAGQRWFRLAAIGLLGVAIVLAVVATIVWFAA